MKISKQTLIDWNKKEFIRTAINEGKAFKINTLVKAYNFDFINRVKGDLEMSQKINFELQNRDLSDISTDTLLKMSISNDNRLKDILSKNVVIGEKEISLNIALSEDGYFDLQLDE